jgi:hypothetical protein
MPRTIEVRSIGEEAAMPVMAIYRRNDVSAELYNRYRAAAPIDTVPRGALAHAYARTGDTSFVSIDIWEDRKALETYLHEVVAPAAQSLGVTVDWPEILPIETFITTPAAKDYLVPFTETEAVTESA